MRNTRPPTRLGFGTLTPASSARPPCPPSRSSGARFEVGSKFRPPIPNWFPTALEIIERHDRGSSVLPLERARGWVVQARLEFPPTFREDGHSPSLVSKEPTDV